MRAYQQGVTLVELMATLVIAAILLAVAGPSFYEFIQNQRLSTMTNSFIGAIHTARTEAIRRGTTVSLCPASSVTKTACGGATDWTNGWIIFVDSDDDGVVASTDDRIKVSDTQVDAASIVSPDTHMTFSNVGFTTTGAGDYVIQMDGCTGDSGRTVNLAASGRTGVAVTACP